MVRRFAWGGQGEGSYGPRPRVLTWLEEEGVDVRAVDVRYGPTCRGSTCPGAVADYFVLVPDGQVALLERMEFERGDPPSE